MKLNLSPEQLTKLERGHKIQLKASQLGSGINIGLPDHIEKQLAKAYKSAKGARIQLQQDMTGEGIFGKKFDRKLKKAGIKKAVFAMGEVAKPLVKQTLSTAVSALASNPYTAGLAPAGKYLESMTNSYMDNPTEYQKKGGFGKLAKETAVNALTSGSGILKKMGIKKGVKKVFSKKNFKHALNETNDVLALAGRDSIQQQIANKYVDDPELGNAMVHKFNQKMDGGRINKYLPTKMLSTGGALKIRSNAVKTYDDGSTIIRQNQAGFSAGITRPNNASFTGGSCQTCSHCGAGFVNSTYGRGFRV